MLPENLTAAHFARYTPGARTLACEHLSTLRQMPLVLIASVLREVIGYDEAFRAERLQLTNQLTSLLTFSAAQRADCFKDFQSLRLAPSFERIDWVNEPLVFTEHLSAYLWSSGQMERYRTAARAYEQQVNQSASPPKLPVGRLGIAVIGRNANPEGYPLFRHLRAHGTYFSSLVPENGLAQLLAVVEERASSYPVDHAHWYVDGASLASHTRALTAISYDSLQPAREKLLGVIQKQMSQPGMGPEQLRNALARLSPRDLGLNSDPVLDHFQIRLLTEGSGTQIFSTTFAQWAAREALRRAQPLTLLVRFAPRQRQRPMSELLTNSQVADLDPQGSLVDADMAAYYQWINQQRLTGAENSAFLVWLEGGGQAVAISPALPRGTESKSALQLGALLALMTG